MRGGVGRGEPSPTPQRALLRAGFARCEGGTSAPGGGASCLHVGPLGFGALPRPTACPWGLRPGPATHWLSVWQVLAWGPVTNPKARALGSWLCALWGRHEDARGGRLLPACGATRFGRSRPPDRPSPGEGGVGVGTRHQPHSARSCELTLRAVGPARGRPGGAPLACMSGVQGWALSHPQPPVPRACGQRPLPASFGCGGCGCGDPSPTPQRALLRADFARSGAARGRPGDVPLACVWGVRVWALTHA